MPDLHTELNFLLGLAFLLQVLIADPINSNFFVSLKGQLWKFRQLAVEKSAEYQ